MADKQRKLARHATVGDVTYGPDDDLPAGVAEILAGNPHVWQTDEEAAADEAAGVGGEPGTSSGALLATHVTYGDVTYGPGDPIPDDVAEALAGNPHIWAEGKAPKRAKARAAAAEPEPEAEAGPEAGPESAAEPGPEAAGAKPTRTSRARTAK